MIIAHRNLFILCHQNAPFTLRLFYKLNVHSNSANIEYHFWTKDKEGNILARGLASITCTYSYFFLSKQTDAEEAVLNKKRSKSTQKKYDERKKTAKVENALEEQFSSGRVLGKDVYSRASKFPLAAF